VAAQWSYDAYGAVQSAADLLPHPVMRAGHKGLFCERLDLGVGLTGELTPRLVPGAMDLYHVRNRAYLPSLGRWMQMDPNGTGIALALHRISPKDSVHAFVEEFDIQALTGDGLHLLQYLQSNPWRRLDPMGLAVIPEGASPLDAGLAPMMLGILGDIEGRLAVLLVEHYAKLLVAADITFAAAAGDGVPSPFAGIGGTGKIGEQALETVVGGEGPVFFKMMGGGRRFLDRVASQIGYEAKVGYQTLTEFTRNQANNDGQILSANGSNTNPISGLVWVFFRSPLTGKGGPSEPLRAYLEKLGIRILDLSSR
jgi:hypothetical protein